MKDKILEQRKIIKVGCYRQKKFKGTEKEDCPHGFIEVNPLCKHCVWFQIMKMSGTGIVVDMEITEEDIPRIKEEYRKMEILSGAKTIDAESVKEDR